MKFLACLALLVFSFAAQGVAAEKKPNFVFFLVDDLGWGDLGCYGSKDLVGEKPGETNELLEELRAWRKSVGAQMPTPNPAYDPAPKSGGKKPNRKGA